MLSEELGVVSKRVVHTISDVADTMGTSVGTTSEVADGVMPVSVELVSEDTGVVAAASEPVVVAD